MFTYIMLGRLHQMHEIIFVSDCISYYLTTGGKCGGRALVTSPGYSRGNVVGKLVTTPGHSRGYVVGSLGHINWQNEGNVVVGVYDTSRSHLGCV
jgi:hypothetical protein